MQTSNPVSPSRFEKQAYSFVVHICSDISAKHLTVRSHLKVTAKPLISLKSLATRKQAKPNFKSGPSSRFAYYRNPHINDSIYTQPPEDKPGSVPEDLYLGPK
jgi:hypothetical protein